MNLDSNGLVIVLGVFLLLIGIVGGGFEVKELKIPRVGSFPRGLSLTLGLVLVFLGMGRSPAAVQPAVEPIPAGPAATGFVPGGVAPAPAAPQAPAPGLIRVETPTPAEVEAIDEHREVVVAQLNAAGDLLRQRGYELVDSNFGAMEQSATETFSILLEAGYEYGFVAACDNDCNDIDLALADESGSDVASDYAADAYPMVEYQAGASATYQVTAQLAHCDVAPCRFGVAVFRK